MRNILCFLLLLAIGTKIKAQNPKLFTLDEAVTYAVENSLTVKNALLGIADAEHRIKENRASGLPTVSAGVDYNYYFRLPISIIPLQAFDPTAPEDAFQEIAFGTKNNLTAQIQARSLIFDWSYLTALKAAKAYRSYTEEQLVSTESEVRNQVKLAYLPPLILEESKKTLEKNIKLLEELWFETNETYKAGFAEQLDVDRLSLSLSILNTDRENIERQLEMAYNGLKIAMGYPINEQLRVSDNIDELLSIASEEDLKGKITYSNRPEYRVATMGKTLNELNITYAKSGYYPSLSAFGSFQKTGQGNKFFRDQIWTDVGLVGLSLSIPIYDGGMKKARINRAKLDLEITQNQIKNLEHLISFEVENARIGYNNAQQKVANQQQTLDLAQKIFDVTQIKFKEGVGLSLEVTTAESDLYSAQQNLIQARYELLQAKVNLDKMLGK